MDTWRRIKLPDLKNGCWSQEEYRNLFNLVNMDLQMKAVEEKVSRHGMLNYNVCWEAISRKLSTQTNASCCTKWPGVVSWKRWAQSQMVRHIGEHRMKSSVEQVEILSKRCCPNLLQCSTFVIRVYSSSPPGYLAAAVRFDRRGIQFRPSNSRGSVNPRRCTERIITPKALRWPQGDSNPGSGANLGAP
ncbi:hypothetical protein CRG98_008537 [Punica granatum]|uniref:Myb-like domain-containing protein n=1 Tax=Punica granatum TaxID=22663 RepID=A0A2I0KRF7_PUNGR|nr:hypothetical protein CRG98_008537 [Punica granatum]